MAAVLSGSFSAKSLIICVLFLQFFIWQRTQGELEELPESISLDTGLERDVS